MKLLRWLLLLGLCAGISTPVWAQAPKVMARATLENNETLVAGQQVQLTIDALTTTWFAAPPIYPELNIANAIVTPIQTRNQNINETIGRETWFGISRFYAITPTGEGDIVIPQLELILQPGQSENPLTATTEAITIKVKQVARPAGTENLLVSTNVQIKQTLDRKLDEVKVGDAITRRIEIQAIGAQGMFIPPTTFTEINGLALYPKTGSVDNHIKGKRDVSGSTRIDAATYVVQSAGNYLLPEIKLEWWNPVNGKIEASSAPALEFNAAANPDYNPEFSLPPDTSKQVRVFLNWHLIGLLASVALLLSIIIYLLAHYLPRLIAYWHAWKTEQQERYAASELAAFKQLEHAVTTGDAAHIYAALVNWVEHPENGQSLDALCQNAPELASQINALRTTLFDITTPANPHQWDGSSLLQAVIQRRQQKHSQPISGTHLAPLNPI